MDTAMFPTGADSRTSHRMPMPFHQPGTLWRTLSNATLTATPFCSYIILYTIFGGMSSGTLDKFKKSWYHKIKESACDKRFTLKCWLKRTNRHFCRVGRLVLFVIVASIVNDRNYKQKQSKYFHYCHTTHPRFRGEELNRLPLCRHSIFSIAYFLEMSSAGNSVPCTAPRSLYTLLTRRLLRFSADCGTIESVHTDNSERSAIP